jgi:hypothetical protein
MKIMSLKESEICDRDLRMVKMRLNACLERMKGKFGTSEAVSNLESAIIWVNKCISANKYDIEFYQQFRNPPNTPKSRRLGWNKKG